MIIRTINIQVHHFVSTSYLHNLSNDVLIYKCRLIPIFPHYMFVKTNILYFLEVLAMKNWINLLEIMKVIPLSLRIS